MNDHERNAGWDGLSTAIAEARALLVAETSDPELLAEGEAYVSRVVTAALSGAVMWHRHTVGGLTTALPVHGGLNPAYLACHAMVAPNGQDRLEGRLSGVERGGGGLYAIGAEGAHRIAPFNALYRDADASGPGSLAIPPDARILMCRILHRDRSAPAQLELSGVAAQRGPTLVGGSNETALAHAANVVRANIREYMKWVRAAREMSNRLDVAPPELTETVVGDADTQYFVGGFN